MIIILEHFINKFVREFINSPTEIIPFARNSRTACLAFTVFISRYMKGNITNDNLRELFNNTNDTTTSGVNYRIFKNIEDYDWVFPPVLFNDKDKYDEFLYKFFVLFIKSGSSIFSVSRRHEPTLNETNFLKKDNNYYNILKDEWNRIHDDVQRIWNEMTTYVSSL